MSKLNHLYNEREILFVGKCLRNAEGDNVLKICPSIQWFLSKVNVYCLTLNPPSLLKDLENNYSILSKIFGGNLKNLDFPQS